jgi:hypothetical protein
MGKKENVNFAVTDAATDTIMMVSNSNLELYYLELAHQRKDQIFHPRCVTRLSSKFREVTENCNLNTVFV